MVTLSNRTIELLHCRPIVFQLECHECPVCSLEVRALLGGAGESRAALLAATEGAGAHSYRWLLWRIQVTRGKVYRDEGRREDAEQAFAGARAIIEELAAGIPDAATAALVAER